ncbi:MAG: hypothetical protein Q7S36_00070 [Candidatus Liptonbacteria bacterium]|nr:hypothetical protein [Candidatus Liptonbacteria bacterium]
MKKLLAFKLPLSLGFIAMRLALPALTFSAGAIWTSATDVIGSSGLGCRIIDFLFAVLIFLTIAFVVFAAFKYLTSGGEPDKIREATHQLLYAAIALVVGLLAKGFPAFIGDIIDPSLAVTGTCL